MKQYRIRPGQAPKVKLNKAGLPRERFEGLRDEAKRAWVREQPCIVAGPACVYARTKDGFQSDAEHVDNKARGHGDVSLVPMCRRHHQERHTFGPKSFEKAHKISFAQLAGEYQVRWEEASGAPKI